MDFRKKDVSLKVVWVKNAIMDPEVGQFAYQSLAPKMQESIWQCNIHPQHVEVLYTRSNNSFWKDVLSVWASVTILVPLMRIK